jgi:hypothetical protein
MVWPDADKPWIYVDEWPDAEAKNRVWEVVKWLDSFDPVKDAGAVIPDFGSTPFKRFDHGGQDLWTGWSTKLNNRPYHGRAMASHLAKYEKLVGALALIFHLVDCATAEGYVDREKPINSHQLGRAIRFSEYLETHAERVYSSGTFGTVEAVKLIRARIVKGDLADGFSARDIYHPQWAGLTDANLVNEAVEMMLIWAGSGRGRFRRKEKRGLRRPTKLTPNLLRARPPTRSLGYNWQFWQFRFGRHLKKAADRIRKRRSTGSLFLKVSYRSEHSRRQPLGMGLHVALQGVQTRDSGQSNHARRSDLARAR